MKKTEELVLVRIAERDARVVFSVGPKGAVSLTLNMQESKPRGTTAAQTVSF